MYKNLSSNSHFACLFCLLVLISACSTNNVSEQSGQLKLQTARYAHAAATDGKLIYVFAGSNKNGFLSDIEIINPLTGHVEVLKDRLIPRRYFSAVWDGQHSIYLIGGVSLSDGEASLERRVEIFDLLTHQISFATPMPEPRRNSRAVFMDKSIFVFGGSDNSELCDCELTSSTTSAMYDTRSQKWRKLADMPSAKSTAVIIKRGIVYVAGGFNHKEALSVFESFDPKSNQWQTLAPMPRKISAHSMALVGSKMVLFGDYEKLDSTLIYDFEDKSWTEPELGFQGTRHNASVTIGNTIYVVGGNINSKGSSKDLIQQFSL